MNPAARQAWLDQLTAWVRDNIDGADHKKCVYVGAVIGRYIRGADWINADEASDLIDAVFATASKEAARVIFCDGCDDRIDQAAGIALLDEEGRKFYLCSWPCLAEVARREADRVRQA